MKPTIIILPTLQQLKAVPKNAHDQAMNIMCSKIRGAIRDYYDGEIDDKTTRRRIIKAVTEWK